MENTPESLVVTDTGGSRLSDLWKKEDYWAIWLGFGLLILGVIVYFPLAPEGMEEKISQAEAHVVKR